MESQVRRLGVGSDVPFLGTRYNVPELMRQADVFVRPSFLEGMPLTVLEAMASALPVVATPVGGTTELLGNGAYGRLFPVGDHRALARSINEVLDDPAAAQDMGRGGCALIKARYTWEKVVEETERVYAQATS